MKESIQHHETHEDNDSYELKELISHISNDIENNPVLSNLEEDAWVYFYNIQAWDTIYSIWNTLRATQRFSYLNGPWYDPTKKSNKIKSWNIIPENLRAGHKILIPLPPEKRDISTINYWQSFTSVKTHLSTTSEYNDLTEILEWKDKEHIIRLIEALTIKESAKWENALFRREEWLKVYSYTRFHFLFNQDWSPFDKARKNLGFTVWETLSDFDKALSVFFPWMEEKYNQFKNARFPTSKKPMKVKLFVDKHFPNWFSDMMDEDKIFELAWLYNGLNDQWERYAKAFVKLYNQLKNKDHNTAPQKQSREMRSEKQVEIKKEPRTKEKPIVLQTSIDWWYTLIKSSLKDLMKYSWNWKYVFYDRQWNPTIQRRSDPAVLSWINSGWKFWIIESNNENTSSLTKRWSYKKLRFLKWYRMITANSSWDNINHEHYSQWVVLKYPVDGNIDKIKNWMATKLWLQPDQLVLVDEFWFEQYEDSDKFNNTEDNIIYFWLVQ